MVRCYGVDRRKPLRYLSAVIFAVLIIYLLLQAHRPPLHEKNAEHGPDPLSLLQDASRAHPGTAASRPTGDSPSAPPNNNSLTGLKHMAVGLVEDTLPTSTASGPVSPQPLHLHDPQLHVVIAHHSEEPFYMRRWIDSLRSIPHVKELGAKIIIYTKNSGTNFATLKHTTAADEVIQLSNVGREGGTYLHHILSVYDDLPAFTMFTQAVIQKGQYLTGEVEDDKVATLKDWLYERLSTKFGNDTGFMSLDRKHDVCYCGHCTDMGQDDFYPLWPQIYAMLENMVCQELEGHVLSFNGHFIVSRKRVLARPRRIYEYLKELVDAREDHWIHSEPEPSWFEKDKGKSMPSNPKFGHTLERLWHVIFNCSNPAQLVDCDVRGMKAEGPGGCTCKDL